tara:strand:- start:1230 stop:2075 length:846 start_codon:yes stop_codon:yes gene_type:complete
MTDKNDKTNKTDITDTTNTRDTTDKKKCLALINPHIRDKQIKFDEPSHTYTVNNSNDKYTSVTTWVHSLFPEFNADLIIDKMQTSKNWLKSKYYNMSKQDIIKLWDKNKTEAANAGTKLHNDIENYYNGIQVENNSLDYQQFLDFAKNNLNLRSYRTEWTIFDEPLKLAGSIDMVFKDSDTDELYIYDWKRTKKIWYSKINQDYAIPECIQHIPSTNYWHYTFQLNVYKAILERNYDIKISKLKLVCFYPEQYKYKQHNVNIMDKEIQDLIESRLSELENQ